MRSSIPMFLLLISTLSASEARLQFLGDDHTGELLKTAAKIGAPVAAQRGIKLSAKDEREFNTIELLDDMDKLVLRRPPTHLVLAVGACDLWNYRKDTSIEHASVAETLERLRTAATQISDAGIALHLITPLAEAADSPARPVMSELAAGIRQLAADGGHGLVDAFELSSGDESYGKRGKLEKATAMAIASRIALAAGLGRTSLPPLQNGDRVVVFTDCNHANSRIAKLSGLDEAFNARYGDQVALAFIEKRLSDVTADISFIVNQRPKLLVLCYGHSALLRDQAVEEFRAELSGLLTALRELKIPTMLMSPLPPNQADQLGPWKPDSPRAQLAREYASAIMALGGESGLPVIDATAAAIAIRSADDSAFFIAQNAKGSAYAAMQKHGAEAICQALMQAWQLEPAN